MNSKDFNLIMNDILSQVKPLYLRTGIYMRLLDLYEKKNKEIISLKEELSRFKNQLPNYIEDIKQDMRKDAFDEHIRLLKHIKTFTEDILKKALNNSSLNQVYYDELLDKLDNSMKELEKKKV